MFRETAALGGLEGEKTGNARLIAPRSNRAIWTSCLMKASNTLTPRAIPHLQVAAWLLAC
jgi:hypothetical protein